LRLFSFGGYGLALAALALGVCGAYDSYIHMRLKVHCVPEQLNDFEVDFLTVDVF